MYKQIFFFFFFKNIISIIIKINKGGSLTQMMENVHNYQYIFQQLHSKKQYKNAFDLLEKYLSSYNSVLNYIKGKIIL